jgi:general L-amino acid transport system permease protein
MHQPHHTLQHVPFYRNVRVLAGPTQVIFALGVVALIWLLVTTMLGNLQKQGIPISFAFLPQPAGFGISEGLPFHPSQSYLLAFGVGVVNTLRVAVVGIILATLLGIGIGVARLSPNWLLARLATLYVETFRNVPLLLWLVFTYAAIRDTLPRLREGPSLLWGLVLMSNRGIALAWPQTSATYEAFRPWLLAGLGVGLSVWVWQTYTARWREASFPHRALGYGLTLCAILCTSGFVWTWMTAQLPPETRVDGETSTVFIDRNHNGIRDDDESPLAGVRVSMAGPQGTISALTLEDGTFILPYDTSHPPSFQLTTMPPIVWALPRIQGFNYRGGVVLSPEFAALLFGLVVYTASFIAEVVRAGILAVPKGQREAAKALGLSDRQTFVLVIFPQALRVIIPPLINQYLNLTKNSSLAIAVGYPDLFSIGLTINNQTGQAIPFVVMIMVAYLSMSLLTSWVLNRLNQRLALKGR